MYDAFNKDVNYYNTKINHIDKSIHLIKSEFKNSSNPNNLQSATVNLSDKINELKDEKDSYTKSINKLVQKMTSIENYLNNLETQPQ